MKKTESIRFDKDRAESSDKLKQNLDQFNILFRKMLDEVEDYAILFLDTEGNILNWNKGAEKIKGYTAEEAIGRNFSIFYRLEDLESRLPQRLIETARAENKASHEGWRIKKDGSLFWASVVITSLHDSNNNIIGFSKVTRDLTERKMAEERQERYADELMAKSELLRRSEQQYHQMVAEVEEYAIILLSMDGKILNWNKGAEKIKGYTEKEARGQNFSIFYTEQDQKEHLPEKLLREAHENNKAIHEGWRVRKDRTRFWGSTVITALHGVGDTVIGFSKVTKDLTERKAYEDRISRQNKQLEEYAYVASHDLQEPLRKIQIFSELLQEDLEDKEAAKKNLSKIKSSAARMGVLIRDVLAYAQVGESRELFENVDLMSLIANIESDFELLLRDKGGRIIYKDLPIIFALPVQAQQLFSNLISNSLKFNENEPFIELVYERHVPGKPECFRILVHDNGIGITSEFASKAFNMFSRMDRNMPGTGIGLALCKKIVETHDGELNVSPGKTGGTTFTIDLPSKMLVGRP